MSYNNRPYRRRSSYSDGSGWLYLILTFFVILVVGASCSYAFTLSPDKAQQKVEDAGYDNVKIGSRHVMTAEWRCGKGYVAFFDFTGTAPNGRVIHGRICKGEPPFQGWRINY